MPLARIADAIVLAAGGSQRMGAFDKLFEIVIDRPLVAWTVAAVAAAESIRRVILVARPEQVDALQLEAWVRAAGVTVVAGGERRQESVAAGVEASDAEVVVLHDGARPLATPALVDAVVQAAIESGVGLPLVPLVETLVVQLGGIAVATVRGERANIKVTVAEDLDIVTAVIEARTRKSSGAGGSVR